MTLDQIRYQKHKQQEKKIDKPNFIKVKIFGALRYPFHQKVKRTHRMGENICERINGQRINLQNI